MFIGRLGTDDIHTWKHQIQGQSSGSHSVVPRDFQRVGVKPEEGKLCNLRTVPSSLHRGQLWSRNHGLVPEEISTDWKVQNAH